MPTGRGWACTAVGAALVVGGRILGTVELFVLGTGILALVALAAVTVTASRPRLEVQRNSEERLHAGQAGSVRLTVVNEGRRRTSPIRASERIERRDESAEDDNESLGQGGRPGQGGRQVAFQLAPLPPGQAQALTYRMSTRRGVYRLGPLTATVEDPFGLARRAVTGTRTDTVVVYPKVEAITLPAGGGGGGRLGGDGRRGSPGAGHDLAALRPYEVGDELRKVHWPSTARLGELMIRHTEAPRRDDTVVFCDLRASSHPAPSHSGDTLEWVLSAAASAVVAFGAVPARSRRESMGLALVTSDGFEWRHSPGPDRETPALEYLAGVSRSPLPLAERARRALGRAGVVVLTTPEGLRDLGGLLGPGPWTVVAVSPEPWSSQWESGSGGVVVAAAPSTPVAEALGQAWGRLGHRALPGPASLSEQSR